MEAISLFKFQTVRSLKEVSSMEQYVKGFQRFDAGEDVRPVTQGTQRDYSSKPLKHSIVKRILVFTR